MELTDFSLISATRHSRICGAEEPSGPSAECYFTSLFLDTKKVDSFFGCEGKLNIVIIIN